MTHVGTLVTTWRTALKADVAVLKQLAAHPSWTSKQLQQANTGIIKIQAVLARLLGGKGAGTGAPNLEQFRNSEDAQVRADAIWGLNGFRQLDTAITTAHNDHPLRSRVTKQAAQYDFFETTNEDIFRDREVQLRASIANAWDVVQGW